MLGTLCHGKSSPNFLLGHHSLPYAACVCSPLCPPRTPRPTKEQLKSSMCRTSCWTECLPHRETPGSPRLLGLQRKGLSGKGRPGTEGAGHLPHVHTLPPAGQLLTKHKGGSSPHPAPHSRLTWVSSPPESLNHLALLQLRKTDNPAGAGRGQHFWNVSLTDSKETAKSHSH